MESSSLEFLDGLIAEEPLLGQNPNDAVLPAYTTQGGDSSYAPLPPQQRFGINTRPKFVPSQQSAASAKGGMCSRQGSIEQSCELQSYAFEGCSTNNIFSNGKWFVLFKSVHKMC